MPHQTALPFGEADDSIPKKPHWRLEERAFSQGYQFVAGVDEAGRGPLCGPVVASAVILDPHRIPEGLNDSKLLTPQEREILYAQIVATAKAWAVAEVSAKVIDVINILEATKQAAREALLALNPPPDLALTDALTLPGAVCPAWPFIKGDRKSLSIAAASILAKVTRDRQMEAMDREFPGYGLARHKGYPTASHRAALARLGPCPQHRMTFKGVKN